MSVHSAQALVCVPGPGRHDMVAGALPERLHALRRSLEGRLDELTGTTGEPGAPRLLDAPGLRRLFPKLSDSEVDVVIGPGAVTVPVTVAVDPGGAEVLFGDRSLDRMLRVTGRFDEASALAAARLHGDWDGFASIAAAILTVD